MILPHRYYGIINQYIAGITACISAAASGSCYGWLTPILTHLMSPESELPVAPAELPWIISIIELGNLVSPLPAGIICNHIGRKPLILASGPIFIISWLMIIFYPTALMLGVARVVQGLAMGLVFTVAPIYLGEIASDDIRGSLTSMFFNSWWVGHLIAYCVGPFLKFTPFTVFILSLNIPFILVFYWQPESPYYYMMKGDNEKAYDSLNKLRGHFHDELNEELKEIRQSLEDNSNETRLREVVATPADRRALTIHQVLTCVRLLSGSATLTVYATQLFDSTPNLTISSDTITIILGVILFVGSCISSFTMDVFGRRPLLLISSIGCLLCQFFAGIYYYLLFETAVEVSQYSWIAPVLLLLYCGLCTSGMYPVCSAYSSELFTTSTRGVASSLSAISVTIVSFVMLASYEPICDILGVYANFLLYAVVTLFGSVYFYFVAPETKGKPFSQIRKELND